MQKMTQAKRSKKGGEVDRVYTLLRHWIVSCKIPPGDFLPEVELALQCNTSRTPIREACNRLAEEKWLSKIQNKGYMVTPISVQDIVEVYQYRRLLECFCAERVAQFASSEEIANLKRVTAVENRPNAKQSDIIEANHALHTGIARLANNRRIYDQLILTLDYVHRLDILSTRRDADWVGHKAIIAALEARDPEAAHNAMGEHVDDARDRMLRIFRG